MLLRLIRPFAIALLLTAAPARAVAGSDTGPSPRLISAGEIQLAPSEQRSRVVGCVAAALADDAKEFAKLRRAEDGPPRSRQAQLATALAEAEAAAKVVRHAMKAAERASDDTWLEIREQLAKDFAAYIASADRVYAFATRPGGAAVASTARR